MVNQLIFMSRVFNFPPLAIACIANFLLATLVAADTSSADYIFLLDLDRQTCHNIDQEYRDIKAFETANFYVTICQKGRDYYYIGEAKTGAINTMFLPAQPLTPGEIYRADNGNISYIITILSQGAILTIERNGSQIALEHSLSHQCLVPHHNLSAEIAKQTYQAKTDTKVFSAYEYLPLNYRSNLEPYNSLDVFSFTEYNLEPALNLAACN